MVRVDVQRVAVMLCQALLRVYLWVVAVWVAAVTAVIIPASPLLSCCVASRVAVMFVVVG
jgi:hypothetical protein